jgi:hypothetical protein
MADRFYGVDRGETKATVAAATTGKDVEVTIDLAVGVTKQDAILALDKVTKAILADENWLEI